MAVYNPLLSALLGLVIAVPSLIMALLAERTEPNPIVGFRISYAMTSREVWVKVNRAAGLAFGVLGLVLIPIGIVFGVEAEVVVMAVSTVAITVALVELSKAMSERALLRRPPVEGEAEEVIAPLGAHLKLLLVAALALNLAVSATALRYVWLQGLPYVALSLSIVPALSAYFTYLSVSRPEAYAYPWVGRRGVVALAVLIPLSMDLIGLSTSLSISGWGSALLWISILLADVVVVVIVFVLLVRRYSGA